MGVGFSYSDAGDYACDDDRTAAENAAAVEHFYRLFPELLPNAARRIKATSVHVPSVGSARNRSP